MSNVNCATCRQEIVEFTQIEDLCKHCAAEFFAVALHMTYEQWAEMKQRQLLEGELFD